MFDTVIIGAGIAGATAAIYASRKRMNYAFITDRYGGQFIESFEVLNYPGIKKASGPEFAQTITDQLEFNDVKLEEGVTAEKIEKNGDNFIVKTNKGDYETRTAIIATGARARRLDVEGEQKFNKKGVTYCAICDGPLFAGKDVVVVGGGNSALEAVDFMKDIANKIYIINIIDKFTGHEY
ncbi:FAD-dependent oxidoreductase, partial [Candidatus Woesearchaeota archaeon]|nr:FAD-dependent oxidoreductase [Candidatus Woesearchaeota archaeon]